MSEIMLVLMSNGECQMPKMSNVKTGLALSFLRTFRSRGEFS